MQKHCVLFYHIHTLFSGKILNLLPPPLTTDVKSQIHRCHNSYIILHAWFEMIHVGGRM